MNRHRIAIALIFSSFLYSTAQIRPENYSYVPAVVYTKNDSVLFGHGYFYTSINKFKGQEPIISREKIFILNGRKIGFWETDSIMIYNVMGYPDSSGWLFKVVSGPISAYCYNLNPWLEYYVYPIGRDSSEICEITPEIANNRKSNYREPAISVEFSFRLSALNNTIRFLQKNNGPLVPYTDSALCRMVGSKITSLLYTKKILLEDKNTSLLAILDFNRDSAVQQPYIDTLYESLKKLRTGTIKYAKQYERLKKAFFAYDDRNINIRYQAYLDNGIVYLRNGQIKCGHIRFSLNYPPKDKADKAGEIVLSVITDIIGIFTLVKFGVGAFIWPGDNTLIGTYGIETPPKGLPVLLTFNL